MIFFKRSIIFLIGKDGQKLSMRQPRVTLKRFYQREKMSKYQITPKLGAFPALQAEALINFDPALEWPIFAAVVYFISLSTSKYVTRNYNKSNYHKISIALDTNTDEGSDCLDFDVETITFR